MDHPIPQLSDVHTVVFDFDGVFTDNKVRVDQDGRESVRCDRADGLGLDFLRTFQRRGLLEAEVFILSTERNPVVLARAKKLKLDCHHGVGDKLRFLIDHVNSRYPSLPAQLAGVVYLGNDLNDLPSMRQVGYAVAPSDAHPMVRAVARLVLQQRGGEGFVRAFLERFLRIHDLSKEELDELVSDR